MKRNNAAVLLSIAPKWCELIAIGKKTVEVRKTSPKLHPPFKCYIYETKGKTDVPVFVDEEGHEIYEGRRKVIGEFVCDRIDEFCVFDNGAVQFWNWFNLESSCLTYDEIAKYVGVGKKGYAWHISELKIYDKPIGVGAFSCGS